MPAKGWKNLSVRVETFDEIQKVVDSEKSKIPYSTVSEFVKSAVEEKLARIKAERKDDKNHG